MPKEWCSRGYPKSYVDGFKLPDEVVVERVVKQSEPDNPTIGVQFEADENGVIIHLRHARSLTQVNWTDPRKAPIDYLQEGYATTFWRFYGPDDQQICRGQLLASRLDVYFGKRLLDDMKFK